jgi:hypothetical protein
VAGLPKLPRRAGLLLGTLAGVALAVSLLAGWQLLGDDQGEPTAAAAKNAPPLVSEAGLAQRSGVRILHVAVTGAGGLLDLRYQVLDPDKAAAVHASAPVLVDESTGAVADQLLMGHRHTGVLHAGQTYYLIFVNPGNLVQTDDRVTVAIGGLRVPHVRVE